MAAAAAKLPVGATGSSGKEICRAFRNQGECRFDTECKYEHSSGSAVEAPPRDYTPKGDCRLWEEKKECKYGDRCRFLHGSSDKRATYRPERPAGASTGEQETCRNYERRGKCRFGDKCRHKHVEGSGPKSAESKDDGKDGRRRRRRGAGGAAGGAAPKSEAKKEATTFDKDGVEICRNYQKGTCRRGDTCTYSHVGGSAAPAGGAAAGGAAGRPRRRRGPPADGAAPAAGGERKERKPREVGQCHDFAENKCEYGADCRFKHGEKDNRDIASIRARSRNTDAACRQFAETGKCEYGAECRYKH